MATGMLMNNVSNQMITIVCVIHLGRPIRESKIERASLIEATMFELNILPCVLLYD